MKRSTVILAAAVSALIGACGGIAASNSSVLDQVDQEANNYNPFKPIHHVERNNYEAAQKLYDDPSTIIWCTAFPANPSANAITVPIAGKLTSSSVSFFPSSRSKTGGGSDVHEYTPERRSLDGMYHGSPPPYRYGFTPGGQYVDFANMSTFCTTKPYKFQRQSLRVEVDSSLNTADDQATQALRQGNKQRAQQILQAAGK